MAIELLDSPQATTSMFTAVDFDPFSCGELLTAIPATEPQQEIWLAAQMGDDANCAYNESQPMWLWGELDVAALKLALQQLVERHDALRTSFSPDGKTLCIATSTPFEVSFTDLSAVPDREAQLTQRLQQVSRRPFDLVYGPLFRVQIIRFEAQAHLVILTTHHVVCDGWSWGVLLPDLAALYSAARQGISASLDAPERFTDYVQLQQQQAHSPEYISAERYWLKQLSGQLPVLELPSDRPRPALKTYNAAREDWKLDAALVTALKRTGAKARCSFFTILLAGFEVFLHRLSGQTDLIVGVPSAGQSANGKEGLVGHCVNFLPMRSRIDGNLSFLKYAQQRRSEILDAYDHQQVSFGSLVKKLALPRDPSRVPLVSVVFNYDRPLSGKDLNFDGLEVELFTYPRAFENFDLFVNASEAANGVVLECQYNTDLYDASTIRQRMAEFEVLLGGIAADPQQSIWQLPILPATEQQLLETWNQTQADYPIDQTIHQLIEAQVEITPDAIAITFGTQSLTYRELNNRANQVAHYLQTLEVDSETLVGVCIGRSLEMVIGLLGILKAGAAYVPLDPAYPPERLATILEDAQVPILLTQQSLFNSLPQHAAKVVCLDADWSTIAAHDKDNLTSGNATQLAYVIYTSGSTGKPKGVAIEHRNTVAFLSWARETFAPDLLSGVLAPTSICFDLSIFELFFPLSVGGRVILTESILLLPTLPTAKEVTLINTVPSAIAELLKLNAIPASVLTINLAGEPLPNKLVQQLYELETVQQVFNLYGPSEDTTYSTVALMPRGSDEIPTIGRPIANTQIHLLDQHLQPVPIGVPAELYISGAGLARGYLNRPDLTQERFIPNPFSPETGSRLYKTGDLARYQADGNIEYLGRIDHQVKLRGFRIELGEIEAVLTQHPQVQQAIAIVREDNPGDKRLVAYVVPRSIATDNAQSNSPTSSELQNTVKAKLPDYMVPSTIVILDTLPLTPNGKIDRKALPIPDVERTNDLQTLVAARDQLELKLVQLWETILGIKPIGITDNFFELGGHSLLAVRLLAEIEAVFNRKLPLTTVFQAPTIAQLAAILNQSSWKPPCPSLAIIQSGRSYPPLFCIHVLGRGLEFYRPLVSYLDRSQPVYGLSTQIMETNEAPPNQVEDLAAYYIKEMRTIQPEGPYSLAGVSFGGVVAYEMAQQLHAQGQQVVLLALMDTFTFVEPTVIPLRRRIPDLIQLLQQGQTKIFFDKVRMRLINKVEGMQGVIDKVICSFYERTGQPLPNHLQDFVYQEENNTALAHYKTRPYPGRVILFKGTDSPLAIVNPQQFDPEVSWRAILGDKLDVHLIPGDHLGILREPNVKVLGEKLNSYLSALMLQQASSPTDKL